MRWRRFARMRRRGVFFRMRRRGFARVRRLAGVWRRRVILRMRRRCFDLRHVSFCKRQHKIKFASVAQLALQSNLSTHQNHQPRRNRKSQSRPAELARFVRVAGLSPLQFKGIAYHPIGKYFALSDDTSVNYMLACRRDA